VPVPHFLPVTQALPDGRASAWFQSLKPQEVTKTKQKPARQQGLWAPASSRNTPANRFGNVTRFLTHHPSCLVCDTVNAKSRAAIR